MRMLEARKIGVDWVRQTGALTPGYRGAWFSGSTPRIADDAFLPVGSDVDICILLDNVDLPPKPGKLLHRDLLLEITYLPAHLLRPVESVLADYHVGNSLWCGGRGDFIIDDPQGLIGAAHDALLGRFTHETWVWRRLENVRSRIQTGLAYKPQGSAFHEHFLAWLFPTGVLCHLPLVAALRNPTIRRRYVAAREVFEVFDFGGRYAALLETLGSHRMTKAQVQHHLDRLITTFDAAAATPLTKLPFASDILPAARAIAIDGTQAMIASGDHREAIFWIAATFARCHAVLAVNDPEKGERMYPHFVALAQEMGVGTIALLRQRAEQTLGTLPILWEASQRIVDTNVDINRNG